MEFLSGSDITTKPQNEAREHDVQEDTRSLMSMSHGPRCPLPRASNPPLHILVQPIPPIRLSTLLRRLQPYDEGNSLLPPLLHSSHVPTPQRRRCTCARVAADARITWIGYVGFEHGGGETGV